MDQPSLAGALDSSLKERPVVIRGVTSRAGKREMSEGAHCPAILSSSPCTKSLHCRAGVRRQEMQRRTSSSKGASGISRLPFTPPLFLMAVLMSSSVSSLQKV